MWWLVLATASADTWGPFEDGFVSGSREDAPVDGVVLYAANYSPEVTATDSAGDAQLLESLFVTGVGAPPVVAIQPPEGGWVAGETYTLSVLGYHQYDETPGEPVASLSFTASDESAPDAVAPQVFGWRMSGWSKPMHYAWGCCEPVRTITVDVMRDDADPWSWTEVVGRFDLGRPSQITTEEIHTHLDVAVGSGLTSLSFDQWLDEDSGPQPPCFDVVAVAANGEAIPGESFCAIDDQVVPAGEGSDVCGCGVIPSAQPWMALVVSGIMLTARRGVGTRRARAAAR
jgi:hypothetical protein